MSLDVFTYPGGEVQFNVYLGRVDKSCWSAQVHKTLGGLCGKDVFGQNMSTTTLEALVVNAGFCERFEGEAAYSLEGRRWQ